MMKNKVSTKTKRRLYLLLIAIISLSSYLGYTLYGYFIKINYNYSQKKSYNLELADLSEKETILKDEIVKLKDPKYVAKFAREKFLYSKDGEIIFRIIK